MQSHNCFALDWKAQSRTVVHNVEQLIFFFFFSKAISAKIMKTRLLTSFGELARIMWDDRISNMFVVYAFSWINKHISELLWPPFKQAPHIEQ